MSFMARIDTLRPEVFTPGARVYKTDDSNVNVKVLAIGDKVKFVCADESGLYVCDEPEWARDFLCIDTAEALRSWYMNSEQWNFGNKQNFKGNMGRMVKIHGGWYTCEEKDLEEFSDNAVKQKFETASIERALKFLEFVEESED